MFLFFLLFFEYDDDIKSKYFRLKKLKDKLSSLLHYKPKNENLESKIIFLSKINKTRTEEYSNSRKILNLFLNKEAPSKTTYIDSLSPILTYKTFSFDVCSGFIVKYSGYKDINTCLIKQFVLRFYYNNDLMFETEEINCYSDLRDYYYDLESNVVFDTIELDVLNNFGSKELTCIPELIINGPVI